MKDILPTHTNQDEGLNDILDRVLSIPSPISNRKGKGRARNSVDSTDQSTSNDCGSEYHGSVLEHHDIDQHEPDGPPDGLRTSDQEYMISEHAFDNIMFYSGHDIAEMQSVDFQILCFGQMLIRASQPSSLVKQLTQPPLIITFFISGC